MTRTTLHTIAAAALFAAVPLLASAQTTVASTTRATASSDTTTVAAPKPTAKKLLLTKKDSIDAEIAASGQLLYGLTPIQNFRPTDQTGAMMFEAPKQEVNTFNGLGLMWGAAFTQDFQNLTHQNTATPVLASGVNTNQLIGIGPGFTTAMANLGLDVQLAKGIRVDLTTYLSTRHHNDTWVKGGYLQIDASPFDVALLNDIMQNLTLRVGQFEVNYGDAHFRRTDGGNGMYNPFVGNLIMDAYTTEIGADAMYHWNGFIAMAGFTGGASDGQVTSPGQHQPAYLGKIGYDKQLDSSFRFRLTSSTYNAAKSTSNVLYSGDRAGSHYFDILGNTTSTESGNAWSGNLQPGFTDHVASYVVNPFVKYNGLEVFGNFETATGAAATETSNRTFRQNSGDVVYRFLNGEQAYVAARYNVANGELLGIPTDVNIQRTQFGAGLFLTKNVLAKVEYVNQTYNGYPTSNILNGGNFRGVMFEGAVGF
jgi:hypothetical protein